VSGGAGLRVGEAPEAAPILLVEDDARLREFICWALEDEGFAVESAADGQQAVAWAARRAPALVLLDWGLPLLGGGEVAASLRAVYGIALPILLISADGRTAEKARQIGAIEYLHKPFEIDDLIGAVRRALGVT
jgi:DNA-binding response OmpR family regulator